jgi:hypothetical protein
MKKEILQDKKSVKDSREKTPNEEDGNEENGSEDEGRREEGRAERTNKNISQTTNAILEATL